MLPKPSWIRIRWNSDGRYRQVAELLDANGVNTVCREARCPNTNECWNRGTATHLILGDVCTRNCRFCGVKKGTPGQVDMSEPVRIANTIQAMGLQHAVITSVTRDDLSDGGAASFSETIREVRNRVPGCTIEVLVPDFQGNKKSIGKVILAEPEVFAHNVETVPRLYGDIRPQADYARSLALLSQAKKDKPEMKVKSGIMLGFGECKDEIRDVMTDLRQTGCDMLTIGQYLQPSASHFPVMRFWTPEEFRTLKEEAISTGFCRVESGPLVRSSYRADAPFVEDGLR